MQALSPPTAATPHPRSADGGLRTEFDFELPVGHVDERGTLHRHGAMRLATARDELDPLIDQRVREEPSYFGIVLLSLVIVRLGTLSEVRPDTVEALFVQDLAYLQELYGRINGLPEPRACPSCGSDLPGGDRVGES
ncbi:hypothetical protein [Streptomyces chrestomyceticus]|uniref:hypothetical protein n=1 Tax=Streptomyces chrestomyceticus TaxID=68185 RepID=UPI0019D1792F|nr:hypothetical protein [Streptomyces chrestomyceticus]